MRKVYNEKNDEERNLIKKRLQKAKKRCQDTKMKQDRGNEGVVDIQVFKTQMRHGHGSIYICFNYMDNS